MKMHRSFALIALLLTACSAAERSPAADLPEIECRGEMPAAVANTAVGYRLAAVEDVVPAVRNFNPGRGQQFTCSIFSADFNADGRQDYALLLVNEENLNSRVQIAVQQEEGQFAPVVLKDFPRPQGATDGTVYTALQFKAAGDRGLDQREYNPLSEAEAEIYVSKPAIEVWQAINTNEAGQPKDITDLSGLSYCSAGYYFADGDWRTVEVCD